MTSGLQQMRGSAIDDWTNGKCAIFGSETLWTSWTGRGIVGGTDWRDAHGRWRLAESTGVNMVEVIGKEYVSGDGDLGSDTSELENCRRTRGASVAPEPEIGANGPGFFIGRPKKFEGAAKEDKTLPRLRRELQRIPFGR